MECSIRTKWPCWIATIIIIFLLGLVLFLFLNNSIFDSVISCITAIATSVLAIFAYIGLKQWKDEIRGSDKYRALINIKLKLLNFKTEYQNVRLKIINQFSSLSEEVYPVIINNYKSYYKRLWDTYDELLDAINFYKIIELTLEKDFLDNEEQHVYSLILDYIASADLYCDHAAKKEILDKANLAHCKKYMFKRGAEDDEISEKVRKLIDDAFIKINLKLKAL